MTMAEIMFYMADLNRKDRLIDLDDGAFPSQGFQNFIFGMASEFFFHSYGDLAVRETMIDLAEYYYLKSNPSPNDFVQGDYSAKLNGVSDIRKILATSRIDPTIGDLKDEFTDPQRNLSFYMKYIKPGTKVFFPSHSWFSCLVEGKAYRYGGELAYHSRFSALGDDTEIFINTFIKFCSSLKIYYATSGFALLRSTYSSPITEESYPLYKRFPGLLYADGGRFGSEMKRRDDAIRDVNWLTAISDAMLRRIGGLEHARKQLSADVILHPYDGGVVFQAGEKPRIGDVNMGDIPSAYREVNRLLRPLRFEGWTWPFYLRVPDDIDAAEATRAWISRFD
ncbi:type VI immunity family protein [Methylobacterium fujisawaense]|uniref:type VI immunity family protein n=1 Tax=Methylobacterium fujisawaense TaxID=107400 RepID=UPI00313DBBB2